MAYLTLLDDRSPTTAASPVTLGVAAAEHADTGGGLSAGQASVRVCARFVLTGGAASRFAIEDLACPTSLPEDVPGLGTVTESAPYSG